MKKKTKRFIRKLIFITIIFLVSGVSTYLYFSFPNISYLKKNNPKKTSFMEYREKEWQKNGKKYRIQQRWVSLSGISPYLIKAVLIAEDDKFWSHEGFDYEAIQKAIEKDIEAKKFKLGGSTISQQLAKNLYLSPSKNPLRKIAEAILTWRMEKVLTKRRILELYLNIAEWGDRGVFGIEAASRHYYGKSASSITPEEAARLASVLPNPKKYNPSGNQRYVINRSNLIYSIMVRRGIVVPEYEDVVSEVTSTEEANIKENSTPSKEPSQTDTTTPQ
ncbi:MAG: monofunctional biosynthetic peptidoglycan transglycosylase [Nitrospirae bacterium]|nr:monofunctional biosynthetic peptidoglycan transglycosylase [Nitrospirota bacterium]